MKTIQQGQIVRVNLDPIRGREQRGTRPVVIISSNGFHASQLCIVCPLTTTLHRFVGDVILEPAKANGLKRASEVLCGHVRSVSQARIVSVIGRVADKELEGIFRGIDMLLGRV
jgi:mRNA interferase MazF